MKSKGQRDRGITPLIFIDLFFYESWNKDIKMNRINGEVIRRTVSDLGGNLELRNFYSAIGLISILLGC